jgi:hypothetical protein
LNVEVSRPIWRRGLAGLFCELFVELADLGLWGGWGALGFSGLVDALRSHCFSL